KWVRRRPAAAGLLLAVVLLVAAGVVGAWLLSQQWATARGRQLQTDEEVRGIVERARDLLKAGWESADLAKLTQAKAEGQRADGIAGSGGARASVQKEALAFRQAALERLERAEKDHTLTEEILDVSYPQEMPASSHDDAGRLILVAQPGLDEQYAGAFRRWG